MADVHPGEVVLQHYADGELNESSAAEVRAHLELCAECRAEVEALEHTWAQCATYRDDLLPGVFAPPPRPWTDLSSRMAELDRARSRRTRWVNFSWLPGDAKAWAVAMALVILAFAVIMRLRETPAVEAAELLRKAVAAQQSDTLPRRIEVRTKTQRYIRVADHGGANAVKSLQARFEAAHYNWDDPLNARSFFAWREQLTDKHDQVIRERNVYRIRTDTSTGILMTASLALRVADLRPVEERFDFRDQDWLELRDAGEQAAPQSDSAPAPVTPKAEGGRETSPDGASVNPTPVAPATAGDELRVFAALHRLKADLGDPIEVARSGGEVRVTGAGISLQRRQQLREELSTLPYVALQFSEPAAPSVSPRQRVAPASTYNNDVSRLQAQLAERIGGREQFEQIASQVLDLSEAMMSRAYALRRLAEHFPTTAESELSGPELQVLNGLRHEHAAALHQTAARMNDLLKPLLNQAGSTPSPGGSPAEAFWQQATEQLFQIARKVDRLSAVLFGNTPDGTAEAQAPAELRSSLAELLERSDK